MIEMRGFTEFWPADDSSSGVRDPDYLTMLIIMNVDDSSWLWSIQKILNPYDLAKNLWNILFLTQLKNFNDV